MLQNEKIIKEYESKYPDLIKSIYQTENQYSKGINVGHLNSIRANRKYIASCEGDDYWTDPYKLQKQVLFFKQYFPGIAKILIKLKRNISK